MIKKHRLKKIKIKLSPNQKSIIIGTLLGDATIATRSGRPILRLKFEQQVRFKSYISHLYEIFKPLIQSPPAARWNKEKDKVLSFWVATRTYGNFKYYYDMFYSPSGVKKVPDQICQLLNPIVLAYWFMDDGTCKLLKSNACAYGLSTQGFGYADQQKLVKALKHCFGLQATINKSGKYYKLYISTRSSNHFRTLVMPYILPVFKYKLGV